MYLFFYSCQSSRYHNNHYLILFSFLIIDYGGGIQAAQPGQTMAGQPMRVIEIAAPRVTMRAFHDWLRSVSHRFTQQTYSLLSHNCMYTYIYIYIQYVSCVLLFLC